MSKITRGKTAMLDLPNEIRNTAEAYVNDPDGYVREFVLHINGKERHIITYRSDKKGAALRHLHTYIETLTSYCYISMPNSYAYKKGTGILTCLKQHMNSDTFLKADIHEFFNSIQYDVLLGEFMDDKTCKKNKHNVELLLQACFYKGHMPIGFITSPVLSDIYLHNVDKQFLNRDDVVYTRYADDFIISGKDNIENLSSIKIELEHALSEKELSLNAKKTYYRQFHEKGDAIHILGVNLVYDPPEINRITISDKYIRETSRQICDFLKNNKCTSDNSEENDGSEERLSIVGKIEFIRHFSLSSYNKLSKMVRIKSEKEVVLSRV